MAYRNLTQAEAGALIENDKTSQHKSFSLGRCSAIYFLMDFANTFQ